MVSVPERDVSTSEWSPRGGRGGTEGSTNSNPAVWIYTFSLETTHSTQGTLHGSLMPIFSYSGM